MLFTFDIAEGIAELLDVDISVNYKPQMRWFNENTLLVRSARGKFIAYHLPSKHIHEISIKEPNDNTYAIYTRAMIDNNAIYINRNDSTYIIDLSDIDFLASVQSEIEPSVLERPINGYIIDGTVYDLSPDNTVSIVTSSGDFQPISNNTIGSGPLWEPDHITSLLAYTLSSVFVLDKTLGLLYEVELASGNRKIINLKTDADVLLVGDTFGDVSVSPDGMKIAYFNAQKSALSVFDTSTFTLLATYDFSQYASFFTTFRSDLAIDWENNNFYYTINNGFGGTDDPSANHLVKISMTANPKLEVLITGQQLKTLFHHVSTTAKFNLNGITVDDVGKLFVNYAYQVEQDPNNFIESGVIELHTKSHSLVNYLALDEGFSFFSRAGLASQIFNNEFYVALQINGVGYFGLVNTNDFALALEIPLKEYDRVYDPLMHPNGSQIYLIGHRNLDFEKNSNTDSSELIAFDTQTQEVKVISSQGKGRGVLGWGAYTINAQRDVLFASLNNYLIIIDPDTGDRAFVSRIDTTPPKNNTSSSASSQSSSMSSSSVIEQASSAPVSNYEQPQLNLPSSITLKESTEFSFQVDAQINDTVIYQLAITEDSHLFSIDKYTGKISAKKTFDFENAQDANSDQVYRLTVNAIAHSGLNTSANVSIHIENIIEYSLKITFPPEGSNVGGLESAFHIRGVVLDLDGQPALNQEGLKVTLGTQQAQYNAATGEWAIDAPIEHGENILKFSVGGNTNIETTATLTLNNTSIVTNPIMWAYDANMEYAYAIAQGDAAVVKINLLTGEQKDIWSSHFLNTAPAGCQSIKQLALVSGGDKIIASCHIIIDGKPVNEGLLEITLSDNSVQYIEGISTINHESSFVTLTHELTLIPSGVSDFIIYNHNTQAIKPVKSTVIGDKALNFSSARPVVNGHNIIMLNEGNDTVSFNWYSLLDADFEGSVVLEAGSQTYYPVIIDNVGYQVIGADIQATDLTTGDQQMVIPPAGAQALTWQIYAAFDEYSNVAKLRALPNGSFLVAGGAQTNDAVVVNPITGVRTTLLATLPISPLAGEIMLFSNPSNTQIAAFSGNTHELLIIDTASFEIIERYDFSEYKDIFGLRFSSSALDWDNNILYSTTLPSWSGTDIDEAVHLMAIDLKDQSMTPLLTTRDLHAYFGTTLGNRYRTGGLAINTTASTITFSLLSTHQDGSDNNATGIYILDLNRLSIIDRVNHGSILSSNNDASYIASDHDNNIAITQYFGGYLQYLPEGETTFAPVLDEQIPYAHTYEATLDANNNRVFGVGELPNDPAIPFVAKVSEIYEANIVTGEHRTIGSLSVGRGIYASEGPLYFEQNNTLLITKANHLFMMDIDSGDRVVVPLQ
ncbi:cadherin repeat domain-containing protein [Marinagarivorans algicola]|uniref:cadherin repeat domain-containing protein n=1 Tax=Marinagarivorans algicola TaxID=1513270 RepID=UPI0006B95207|nr:cadherin repeat domain-containing protein [Marinagarivorans algicola]